MIIRADAEVVMSLTSVMFSPPAAVNLPSWPVGSVQRDAGAGMRLCLCGCWKNYKQETKVPFLHG